MPCKDITDWLRIKVDANDNFEKYIMKKLTCGATVGQRPLIIKWLKGKPAVEIVELTTDQLLDAHPTRNDIDEFLHLKHFLAVRRGLAIMLGHETGTTDDWCTVESIEHSEQGTELVAHLTVDGMTDEIKACGRCCITE